MRLLAAAALMLALALPASAQQIISQVSREEVAITSSFTGETLTLFGSIEPEAGSTEAVSGPFHMIITVTGPLQNRVARRKTNQFGIWLNTAEVTFEAFPSFYQVLSDTHIDDITDKVTLAEREIPLENQARYSAKAGWWNSLVFGSELVRLMQQKGQFKLNEQAVVFRSDTFYFAQVSLPGDAPPGAYIAHSYLFKDKQLIAEKTDGFSVRKIGFERFLGQSARQFPLLYGLVCVVLALFVGWLGGVVFKR